jgi:hypothetical protein
VRAAAVMAMAAMVNAAVRGVSAAMLLARVGEFRRPPSRHYYGRESYSDSDA